MTATTNDCIFCKIVAGDIPANIVYEDEHCIAFKDINPRADTHVLLIPRKHIASLMELQDTDKELFGHMMITLPKVAKQLGLDNGYRTIVNTGPGGGQEVYHVHFHILAGKGKLPFA
ncbi:MAG: histidine triad nucleotide-binding protein [Pseudomonadota bacterium]